MQLLTEEFPMMKHVLAGCSLVALLSVGNLSAQAQTQTPTNKAPASPAPVAEPAPAQTNVSKEELKKFATAVKQMLTIAQDAETKMTQTVKDSPLGEARFNEIYLSKKDPASKPNNRVTPKEEQTYNQVVSQLTQLQKDAQAKMDKAVLAEGIPLERFNQIFSAVQKNPQLRQEVQQMIRN